MYMTALLLVTSLVLILLLRPINELRLAIMRKRRQALRKERKVELFGVNPHRQGPSVKRSRFFRTMFLMKQNDPSFVENTKLIYGNILELDNSFMHTDTTRVVDISEEDLEVIFLATKRKKVAVHLATSIKVTKRIVARACSLVIRRTRKIVLYITRAVTKYIHNTGGQTNEKRQN